MGEEILYVQFNQDFSSLGVGTTRGWSLSTIDESGEKFEKIHGSPAPDGVQIVERLFSSSLVAIVSLQSPRKLRVCHYKKGNEICNFSYTNTILAVRLNRARLVVCLEEMLHIHNIRDMKILHTIRDTPPNPNGLLALSVDADHSYLAYPGSSGTGQVQIFDAYNLQAKTEIQAHNSPLAALAFNKDGTRLATASEKGTVIRVYDTNDSTRLFEFRRGMKRNAAIYSISFSMDSDFLAVSSNTETIHVFRLKAADVKEEAQSASWMDYLKGALPTQVTEVWTQGRAFATIQTPFHEKKSVTAVISSNNTEGEKSIKVLVAAYDGTLYVYGLNTQEGGECSSVKQHTFMGTNADTKKTSVPAGTASYAGVVKGRSPQSMSESDKMAEIRNAVNSPTNSPQGDFPDLDEK